jgi:hypothetical protein
MMKRTREAVIRRWPQKVVDAYAVVATTAIAWLAITTYSYWRE